MRRFEDPPERNRRYIRRPGVYVILRRSKMILATCQVAPKPEIQLPGGGVDPGEHPVRALHREVIEETGFSISRPRRLGAYARFDYMEEYDLWAWKLCHIYQARPCLRLGPPTEADHYPMWLSEGEALEVLTNEGDRHFLSLVVGRPGP